MEENMFAALAKNKKIKKKKYKREKHQFTAPYNVFMQFRAKSQIA